MYWVIQENIYSEEGLAELVSVLDRYGLPYSFHKVVPFVGELTPDVNPGGPVIVIGAYSMIHIAKARGWVPGVFSNENFDFQVWRSSWGKECLNYTAKCVKFADVSLALMERQRNQPFFMRPTMDSKAFTGQLFEWRDYYDWRNRVVELGEEDGSTLRGDTTVLVTTPKNILREYRLWVVDGRVVTASLYKIGDRVRYDALVEQEVIDYGNRIASRWGPDRAYVLDVCLTEYGYKIVEVNSLNAAGLYAANVGKLVAALEGMGYEPASS